MERRALVLLFDIDGTLISTGGAGRRAIERAFEIHYGRRDAFSAFSFGGMTDRAILRAGWAAIGREPGPMEMDEVLATYVGVLEDEVARAERYRLHDGIEPALAEAASLSACAIGLGTGNIKEGARVKLTRVGIYGRFAFGGFGSDHEQRPELIRIGAERGAAHLGRPLSECRVVVIGDTPKDVHAAQAIGAESVAVATGSSTLEELVAAGATHVFPDLTACGALDALFAR
jgi:phosphoglycolate phosphatase-like HAD superfamily hydrolase